MDIKDLRIDGTTVSCLRFGDPKGQPFVIIPGLAIKSVIPLAEFIGAQYRLLADRYDLYLIDRRNSVPNGYSIYDMADDTAKALDMLGVKNADIYGVSQGGMIAQAIACKRPDLLRRMILCSTAAYVDSNAAGILEKWAELAAKREVSALMLSFAENVYSADYFEKNKSAVLKYGETVTEEELDKFVIMAESFNGFDVRKDLINVKAPTLVLGGEKDRIFCSDRFREIAELTNAELCIYSGDAHSVYDENADLITRIKQFCDKQS